MSTWLCGSGNSADSQEQSEHAQTYETLPQIGSYI